MWVLWCIDPFLGKDLKTNKASAIAMQWHDKHAFTTLELLLETVFFSQCGQRGYKEDKWGDSVEHGIFYVTYSLNVLSPLSTLTEALLTDSFHPECPLLFISTVLFFLTVALHTWL
jgi:hypothetical protein